MKNFWLNQIVIIILALSLDVRLSLFPGALVKPTHYNLKQLLELVILCFPKKMDQNGYQTDGTHQFHSPWPKTEKYMTGFPHSKIGTSGLYKR